ncbi:RagB/SusD family nutrient uptake outer membrane protein [Puteibacter caeruleilacunae]|nr:RagB/SusD family nutrient uptake outer membrane protein [Puteibacter caeruleilacunae]
MKILMRIMLVVLTIGLTVSCEDDFDNGTPNQTSPKDFFSKTENVELAVKGMYISAANAYDVHDDFLRLRTGMFKMDPALEMIIANNQMDSEALPVLEKVRSWKHYYEAINQCNYILENITSAKTLLEREVNSYKGEAYFLRALMYWQLSNIWGDVPLVLKYNDAQPKAKSTVDKIKEQVQKDIEAALPLLSVEYVSSETGQKVTGDRSRATKGAALALKMDFFLQQENYTEVLAGYEMYADIYKTKPAFNGWYRDALFGFNAEWYSEKILVSTLMNMDGLSSVYEAFQYDAELKKFDERGTPDKRVRSIGIVTRDNSDAVLFYIPSAPVYRYPELLLMAIEAKLHQDAFDDAKAIFTEMVERVYERAPDKYSDADMTKAQLTEYLKLERKRELVVSGRLFWKMLKDGELSIDENKVYLPVGEDAFEHNPNMIQNPNWN